MDFDKIVKKLSNSPEKIIDTIDLGRFTDDDYPEVDRSTKTKVYKMISRLKDL